MQAAGNNQSGDSVPEEAPAQTTSNSKLDAVQEARYPDSPSHDGTGRGKSNRRGGGAQTRGGHSQSQRQLAGGDSQSSYSETQGQYSNAPPQAYYPEDQNYYYDQQDGGSGQQEWYEDTSQGYYQHSARRGRGGGAPRGGGQRGGGRAGYKQQVTQPQYPQTATYERGNYQGRGSGRGARGRQEHDYYYGANSYESGSQQQYQNSDRGGHNYFYQPSEHYDEQHWGGGSHQETSSYGSSRGGKGRHQQRGGHHDDSYSSYSQQERHTGGRGERGRGRGRGNKNGGQAEVGRGGRGSGRNQHQPRGGANVGGVKHDYNNRSNQYDNKQEESKKQQKDTLDKLYELRIEKNSEPMQLLYSYKDYGNPGFFQSPKYNFLKEASFGNAPKHIRQQHEAEASKCFDFVQESFMFGDRYESQDSPLVLQKFESADYGDESPRMVVHIPRKPEAQDNNNKRNRRGGHNGGGAGRGARDRDNSHEGIFDISKERNKGNQFWKQGKGREEHKALEIAAKQRRNNKGKTTHTISTKVQILEEPLSDEVSPGVTRTLSPQMSPKSSGTGQNSKPDANTPVSEAPQSLTPGVSPDKPDEKQAAQDALVTETTTDNAATEENKADNIESSSKEQLENEESKE